PRRVRRRQARARAVGGRGLDRVDRRGSGCSPPTGAPPARARRPRRRTGPPSSGAARCPGLEEGRTAPDLASCATDRRDLAKIDAMGLFRDVGKRGLNKFAYDGSNLGNIERVEACASSERVVEDATG